MRLRRGLAALALLAVALPAGGDDLGEPPPPPARPEAVDAVPRGPSVDERLAEIRRRIQAAVVYPPLARKRGLEGVAMVGFEIDQRDGLARGIELVDSSGHPSLDRAAERSVVRAGTLPWVYGRLEVPVRFELRRRQR